MALSAFMLASLAGDATGQTCQYEACDGAVRYGTQVSIYQQLRLTFTYSNALQVASGSVGVSAVADGGQTSAAPCPCESPLPQPPDLGGAGGGASDLIANPLSFGTGPQGSGFSGASAIASASASEQLTETSTSFFVGEVWWLRWYFENGFRMCNYQSAGIGGLATAAAKADASRNFTRANPTEPMIVTPNATVIVQVENDTRLFGELAWFGCNPPANGILPWVPFSNPAYQPPGPTSQVLSSSVTVTTVNSTGGTSTTVHRGILRSPSANHSWTGLGFYNAAAFQPNTSGNINAFNIPISLGGAVTDPQSISTNVKNEYFTFNSGDIDGDGYVCWRDRVLVNRQVGKTLSDADYDPRADFDLNGTVSSADANAYLVVYLASQDAVPPCPARCNGDVNYDGYVNTADLTYFLGRFGQSGAPYENGDINGDGLTNSADLPLLTGNIGASCV